MTRWNFPCSDPVDISIQSWAAGSIVVSGEPTPEITVEVLPSRKNADIADLLAQVQVSFDDGQLYITGPRHSSFRRKAGLDLTIKAPTGSSCAAKTVSADLACVGELGAVAMQTASGDVTVASVTGDVAVQSASGDVLLNTAGGKIAISTASGDIQATQVDGDAQLNSASGDVSVGYCSGSVTARTASGDIELGCVATGQIELTSVSGDLEVAVVPGMGVYLDLASNSGDIRSELEPGDSTGGPGSADAAVEIKCRTLSGDINIRKDRSGRQPAAAPDVVAPAITATEAGEPGSDSE